MIKKIFDRYRQFILYCLCGGSGVVTDYALYYVLVEYAAIWYQTANIAGYIAGTALSFALNRVVTFNMRDQTGKRLTLFFINAGIGYVASALLLGLLVDVFAIDSRIAKALTLPMVVILQFTLNKKITFRGA